MVALPNIYVELQDTMFKANDIPNGDSKNNKNSIGQRIWPLLVHQRNDKNKSNRPCQSMANRLEPPKNGDAVVPSQSNANKNSISLESDDPECFHGAVSPILSVAQLFGILPVYGIRCSSPLKLRFKTLSLRTFYAVSIVLMILLMAILSVMHMIKTLNTQGFEVHGGIGAATSGAIFYGNSLFGILIFLWLSPRWVKLQRHWRAMEQFIDSNKPERLRLRWKFLTASVVILLLALTEHILSIANNTEGYEWSTNSENSTFHHFLRIYCYRSHAFILENLEYNFALGIYIFIISKVATFIWNFTDVFIMLVSIGLAERYKSLNRKLIIISSKHRSVDWREFREDYALLSDLVKKVDDDLSPIILLSFANNLYFICLQLLNGLSRPSEATTLNNSYFFGSFAFLVGRTCAVTLLTARINDQSRLVLPCLYNCATLNYNVEAQRLQYQLTTDDIALTGMRFFSITRNFMLAVAGAIITYEVVLLQFNVAMKQ